MFSLQNGENTVVKTVSSMLSVMWQLIHQVTSTPLILATKTFRSLVQTVFSLKT
ncbi:hypothetical protein MBAV_000171 [Candidatus Magnetobacterium bavaricum]|uniref:Uncharacterized protein n=1 Tax=Candidatus Magnetobacterium bavaricum TaxID=29290 RepID=A0A0F3H085_9BACT|nr:hypothetical protein MBAV_000171 [Candidatus Magnetobacterium bavaricum]